MHFEGKISNGMRGYAETGQRMNDQIVISSVSVRICVLFYRLVHIMKKPIFSEYLALHAGNMVL